MQGSLRFGVALLCLLAPTQAATYTGWVPNGVPLSKHRGIIRECRLAPDGSSGAIYVFERICQDHGVDLYAQRFDPSGTPLWTDFGAPVCTAEGDQTAPVLTSDGAGGAIITWIDGRGQWEEIYAQRINSSGVGQWGADGIPLCPAAVPQNLVISSDGSGGAIVTWQDHRDSWYDIYAQRIDAAGVVKWATEGVPICTADWSEWHPAQVSDGEGGAIIAWSNGGIYAQRVNGLGEIQWQVDGVTVCGQAADLPAIVSDGAQGAVLTWVDSRRASVALDVYAQRIDGSGVSQWQTDGVEISAVPGALAFFGKFPRLVPDETGGAIITWWDDRSDTADIYVQRVNGSGTIQWGANGKAICQGLGSQYHPQIAPDGVGGAVVAWQDYRDGGDTGNDVYAQRVNSSGSEQWDENGIPVCTAIGDQENPEMIPTVNAGTVIAWSDCRNASSSSLAHAFTQRMDGAGTAEWRTGGLAVATTTGEQRNPALVSDGVGGAIVAWVDNRSEAESAYSDDDIYAQRMDASAVTQWSADDVPVCTAMGLQSFPSSVTDGAGGAIITWQDERVGYSDVYAQRLNSSGAALWAKDGVVVCGVAGDQSYPRAAPDGAGGAIVVWEDARPWPANKGIYGQHIDGAGTRLWASNGIPICTATGGQDEIGIIPDGVGGAIVVWCDGRNGDDDIFAQRVNGSGAVQWASDGLGICTATGYQANPQIVSDGIGGAVITWVDERAGEADVYAQRISSSGVVQWDVDGVAICTEPGNQAYPKLVSDSDGGAIIVWSDHRVGTTGVYAQRIGAAGVVVWAMNGAPVSASPTSVGEPTIGSDGAGGAVVAWTENNDIYAQHVTAAGSRAWVPDDLPVCMAAGTWANPVITSNGRIVAWVDSRAPCEIPYIYASVIGGIVPTLLGRFSWSLRDDTVCLEWTLSVCDEDARFYVRRSTHSNDQFVDLPTAEIEREDLCFRCVDNTCLPGVSYTYRVEYEAPATSRLLLFETETIAIPSVALNLYQNHPNPFNPTTTISFTLPERTFVRVSVYDIAGRLVATLVESTLDEGYREVPWNGKDARGEAVSSGVYFYRLTAGDKTLTKKMVLLK